VTGPDAEYVSQVVLDDLFFAPPANASESGGGGRGSGDGGSGGSDSGAASSWEPMPCPIRNPFTGEPLRPSDVGFVKIDAESFDVRAAHGMRRSLEAGLASNGGLTLEFHPSAEFCDPLAFVEYLEELGFRYLHPAAGGVGGSRWMTGTRLRRQLYAERAGVRCNVAGHIERTLEGLWLRGDMLRLASVMHPMPTENSS
jgi:hypothetical protein